MNPIAVDVMETSFVLIQGNLALMVATTAGDTYLKVRTTIPNMKRASTVVVAITAERAEVSFDFEVWLTSRFQVKPSTNSLQVYINCPFCSRRAAKSPDVKFHLGVSLDPALPVCHCFRCGYKAHVDAFVSEIEGVPHQRRQIRSLRSVQRHEGTKTPAKQEHVALPQECRVLDGSLRSHKHIFEYLYARGVTDEIIKEYGLGFCQTGDYCLRVIIPIVYKQEVVGFTSRTVANSNLRYKFPRGFDASKFLYNYDRAKRAEVVIIVEGPFDALKIPHCAVSLFTNRMSKFQELLILKTWKQAVVLLDREARLEAREIFRRLSQFIPCIVAQLPRSKDPGEASINEIREAIAFAGEEQICI